MTSAARFLILVSLVCSAFALSAPVHAQATKKLATPEAQAHFDRGTEAYSDKHYAAAIRELRRAAELDPASNAALFAWGQAEKMNGDCEAALRIWRRILARSPDLDAVKDRILACETELASHSAASAEPEPEPEPEPDRPRRSAWYRDAVGDALVLTGVAGLAIGAGFLVAAHSAENDVSAARTLEGFNAAADRADKDRLIGWLGVAAGSTLVVAGVIRFVVHGGTAEASPSTTVVAFPGGAGVGVAGRF